MLHCPLDLFDFRGVIYLANWLKSTGLVTHTHADFILGGIRLWILVISLFQKDHLHEILISESVIMGLLDFIYVHYFLVKLPYAIAVNLGVC